MDPDTHLRLHRDEVSRRVARSVRDAEHPLGPALAEPEGPHRPWIARLLDRTRAHGDGRSRTMAAPGKGPATLPPS